MYFRQKRNAIKEQYRSGIKSPNGAVFYSSFEWIQLAADVGNTNTSKLLKGLTFSNVSSIAFLITP